MNVLRDVAMLTWLALMAGVMVYRVIDAVRPASTPPRVRRGKVVSEVFAAPDALVVAAVCVVLLFGLSADPGGTSGVADGAADGDGADKLTVNALLVNAVFMLFLGGVVLAYLKGIRQLNWVDLFGLRRISLPRLVGAGLLLLGPVVVVVNLSAYAVGAWLEGFWELEPQNTVQAFQETDQIQVRLMMVAFAVVIAPLVEEILFRGFIYPVFKKYTDGVFAAVCSSLLFGLVHMHVGSLAPLVVLALILCLVYDRSGSLLLPIMIHAGFNAVSLTGLLFLEDAP